MEPNTVEIEVRFNEQDEMGIAHHSTYYIWFEIARYHFADNILGIGYEDLKKSGVLVPVVHAECKYLKPARYPDRLIVKCYYEPAEKSALILHYEIFRKTTGEKLAYGKTINVFTNMQGRLLLNIPDRFRGGLAEVSRKPGCIWNGHGSNRWTLAGD
jgi:acyl-CoA thioester hydrolase